MTPSTPDRKDRPQVNPPRMNSPRTARFRPLVWGGLCALAALWFAPAPAFAQGRLEAHYEATLSGLPVGRGVWNIEISDDSFSAAASGGTSGILNAIAGGRGTGASQGRVVGGALLP